MFEGELTVGKLKCVAKCNHNSKRSNTINKGTDSKKCLRYAKREDWAYMV